MDKLVYIDGMHCAHCAATVKKTLEKLGLEAEVDLASACAQVRGEADPDAIRQAIGAKGFTVTAIEDKQ